MAQFGLGNFVYEVSVKDGAANFEFRDPEDANNTASVSVDQSDFPEGAPADSRQVAEHAFAQCEKVLNDARDARLHKEAADAHQAQLDEQARQREAAAEWRNNSQELADTTPTGVVPEAKPDKAAAKHDNRELDSVPDDSDNKSDKKGK